MNRLATTALVLVAVACFSQVLVIGQASPPVAVSAGSGIGTVSQLGSDAPVYLLPDASRQPLMTAKAGSTVRVLSSDGPWANVQFQDGQAGRRVGYIQASVLTPTEVAPPAAAPVSTSAAPTASTPARLAQEAPVAGLDKAALLSAASKVKGPVAGCFAGGGALNLSKDNVGFFVVVQGPVGRVAMAMADAKKMYKPFSAESITDEMATPVLTVMVTPDKPSFGPTHLSFVRSDDGAPAWHLAPLAKHVVLKTRPKKGQSLEVLQPVNVVAFPVEWSNAVGGKFSGQGVTAWFDNSALRTFAVDDIDVAIVSDSDNERCCKIGKNDLAKVQ